MNVQKDEIESGCRNALQANLRWERNIETQNKE